MYAAIHHHGHLAETAGDPVPAGRRLASDMSKLPGFIAYLLLDAGNDTYISVSLFEDQASLAEGARVVAGWVAVQGDVLSPEHLPVTAGEVLVQKGI